MNKESPYAVPKTLSSLHRSRIFLHGQAIVFGLFLATVCGVMMFLVLRMSGQSMRYAIDAALTTSFVGYVSGLSLGLWRLSKHE